MSQSIVKEEIVSKQNSDTTQAGEAGHKQRQGAVPERTEIENVIFNRRSTRKFRKEQVPPHLIRRMLEAGRFAPSAGNSQPWRFIVVQNAEMIHEMEESIMKSLSLLKRADMSEGVLRDLMISGMALLNQNLADVRPLGTAYEVSHGRFKVFHGAPTVILVLKDLRGVENPDFDTGLCSMNISLTAHALGLGTCFVGFAHRLTKDSVWLKKMKIEYPFEISTALATGFPRFDSDGLVQRDQPQIDWYSEGKQEPKILF